VQPTNVQWFSEIESKTRGVIKVYAKVPGSQEELSWRVDLVHFNIFPISPKAVEIGTPSQ
jgi:hypothetical protein